MTVYQLYAAILRAPYHTLQREDASYYINKSGDTLFLLFEWSHGKTDWKNNLDFPAIPYGDMKRRWFVHRGFLRVFKALKPQITCALGDAELRRIYIGGYSHGAALAVLCHEYCVFRRPDLAGHIFGVGYGCPRVIWGPLPAEVAVRWQMFSVVRDGRDVVTHLPPAALGFRHVGHLQTVGDAALSPADAHRPENYTAALFGSEVGRCSVERLHLI